MEKNGRFSPIYLEGRKRELIDEEKADFLPMQEEGFLSSLIWEKGSYESGAGSVPWQFTVNSAAENKNEKSQKEKTSWNEIR